ncbi:MAG: NADH-quinone oxidoreductase subunit N [Chlorobia bacterium]|nr:NADH-quinone oxidoreductase subunit N [Fimbriimonadaceae bacterium]
MQYKPALPQIEFSMIAPVVLVAMTGIIALCIEMNRPKKNNNMIVWLSLLGLAVAGISLVGQFDTSLHFEGESMAGMVTRDRFSLIMQLLLVGSAFLSILFSEGYLREKRIPFGEFYPMLLWSTVGAMVMVTSRNLLMIFLGLEVLSIALYVLAGMSRKESKSEESALKYFLLGAFASGFLLYGIAFIYGATGSLHLDQISIAWIGGDHQVRTLLVFGLGLLLIGLSFKSSFVPFHMWTPDVYQGAPTNVTAFMVAGSKIAAVAALYRVADASGAMQDYWLPAMYWIAILTMTVGNLTALVQKDVKRVLGYSSIAHAGYILVAILAHVKSPDKVGSDTISYYLLSYSLMTIGAFAVVTLSARAGKEGTKFDDVRGLWHRAPLAAGALIVFMCSLIGIPGTAGFIGKLLIFKDALTADLLPLAIVLAFNSIISVYYYLGIGRAMFVADEEGESVQNLNMNHGLRSACVICMVGIFGAFVLFSPIMQFLSGH